MSLRVRLHQIRSRITFIQHLATEVCFKLCMQHSFSSLASKFKKFNFLRGLTLTSSIMHVLFTSIRRDKQARVLIARTTLDSNFMLYTSRTVLGLTRLTVELKEKSYQQSRTSSTLLLCSKFFNNMLPELLTSLSLCSEPRRYVDYCSDIQSKKKSKIGFVNQDDSACATQLSEYNHLLVQIKYSSKMI